ncbi:Beta-1,4-galactosyltransferase 4 [Lepeophtheirus salmonis]|uniref:Beta-1,4-N-acetylgalactosaminyltransferase n=1 Tax=Lepeophtheirus salmonis TaxID=72036 RepID=A0A7R8CST4_LEPSM|nr:Beta-1,4-galactosyltransferase 4 [Lepeophtheirus salmonis]CAF2883885.1 Beta-1,4-galactosyltransferase 4 [Lepeophtheirus salmonis]
MNRNIIPSDLNNKYIRNLLLCLLIIAQIYLLVSLRSYKSIRSQKNEESHSKNMQVDFVFDEQKFLAVKENLKEEILNEFNDDPKEAFKSLRQKLSKEANTFKIIQEQVDWVRNLVRKAEESKKSILGSLTSIVFPNSRIKRSILFGRKCPEESPKLLGDIFIQEENIPELDPQGKSFHEWFGPLQKGGIFKTEECEAEQRVAIIIPFRDREEHLNSKEIKNKFNRGALMNVGYQEAQSSSTLDFNCFIFQDVDLIPENDHNLYTCAKGNQVKHMAVAVSKWKYKLIYNNYFGGVTALSKEQFTKINGFANGFYGWGGEDDDFYRRIDRQNFTIFRLPGYKSRYTMLKHDFVESDEDVVNEMNERSESGRLHDNGISNLMYEKLDETQLPLYTRIKVRLPPSPKVHKKQKNIFQNGANSLLNKLMVSSIMQQATT